MKTEAIERFDYVAAQANDYRISEDGMFLTSTSKLNQLDPQRWRTTPH